MTTAGWEGILDADETILWQGRPDGGIAIGASQVGGLLFGLAFAGFALFWMIMASQAGGFFWMFGLIHFCVGLGIIAGPTLWPAYRRRKTWYTLTDKRAFIASINMLGQKSLKSYPITKETPIEYVSGAFDTINFASEQRRGKNRTYTVPVGFERLQDGPAVTQLIREIQKDTA